VIMLIDDVSVPVTQTIALQLYPNPARSIMNIVSDQAISELRVIDMLGNVVFTSRPGDERSQLNVSSFQNGVYFIQIMTSRGIQTKRFQIAK
jgi:hypothetical protein